MICNFDNSFRCSIFVNFSFLSYLVYFFFYIFVVFLYIFSFYLITERKKNCMQYQYMDEKAKHPYLWLHYSKQETCKQEILQMLLYIIYYISSVSMTQKKRKKSRKMKSKKSTNQCDYNTWFERFHIRV